MGEIGNMKNDINIAKKHHDTNNVKDHYDTNNIEDHHDIGIEVDTMPIINHDSELKRYKKKLKMYSLSITILLPIWILVLTSKGLDYIIKFWKY